MKTITLVLGLLIWGSSVCVAQTSVKQGIENKMAKKKQQPRKQMSHFDKTKSDPNIKYNGTEASLSRKPHKYVVDRKSFKSPKYFTDSQKTVRKRTRNKTFNTYTYK
jgi:hypothetical protein